MQEYPMNNILIATDLTDSCKNAFRRAIKIAQSTDAKLHILHVTFVPLISGMEDKIHAVHTDIKRRIGDFVDKHTASQEIRHAIHLENRGRVYDAIYEYAQKTRAELIVIGASHRLDDMPPTVLSTSEQVLSQASHPVFIITQPAATEYKNILVDASPPHQSLKLLDLICKLGRDIQFTLILPSAKHPSYVPLFQPLIKKIRAYKDRYFINRVRMVLEKHGISNPPVIIKAASHENQNNVLALSVEQQADILVTAAQRPASFQPENASSLRRLLQSGTCDALFGPGV